MLLTVRQMDLDEVFMDIARLHSSHREGISAGEVFKLKVGSRCCRVVARGAPSNEKNVIWLDLKTRETLGIGVNSSVEFQIIPGRFYDGFIWACSASEPSYRIASHIAVISFLLGLLGAALGLWSLILTI